MNCTCGKGRKKKCVTNVDMAREGIAIYKKVNQMHETYISQIDKYVNKEHMYHTMGHFLLVKAQKILEDCIHQNQELHSLVRNVYEDLEALKFEFFQINEF